MISYKFHLQDGYVLGQCEEPFAIEELMGSEAEMEKHHYYRKDLSRIFDFSKIVDLSTSTSKLVQTVKGTRNLAIDDHARIALVAEGLKNLGVLRLYASHFEVQPIRVFSSLQLAESWINNPGGVEEVDQRFRVFQLNGKISLDDILREQIGWYDSEEFDANRPALWDLRGCVPGISLKELDAKTDYVVRSSESAGRSGRTAILVDSHLMEMMVKRMMSGVKWRSESRLFRNLVDSVAWLSEQDES